MTARGATEMSLSLYEDDAEEVSGPWAVFGKEVGWEERGEEEKRERLRPDSSFSFLFAFLFPAGLLRKG